MRPRSSVPLPFCIALGLRFVKERIKKSFSNLCIVSKKTGFSGPLTERARAEEEKHRGTEVTENGGDLCLRALCASGFQSS